MKKFAVVLSGCGSQDGSEIHEATMLLLAIKQLGADYKCFSIDKEQTMVANFITGQKMNEKRNVLVESARIARGNIDEVKNINVNDFDGIVLPGGFGAALNLSTFGLNNNDYTVEEDLKKKLIEFKNANKPICATCIAPMILAKVFQGITITLGNDESIAKIVQSLGNTFKNTNTGEICIDEKNKIVTTPFYMLAENIKQIYDEAYKAISATIDLMK